MESVAQFKPPPSFQRLYETDYKFCVVCQKDLKERLISPKSDLSYNKLLKCIQERAELNDGLYEGIYKRTSKLNIDIMKENVAKYHKSCYSRTCLQSYIQKLQTQKSQEAQECLNSGENSSSYTPTKSTRSKIPMFSKIKCVFCDKEGVLHRVATQHAAQNLLDAAKILNKEEINIKLSSCVGASDLFAQDVSYHKNCWSKFVINNLRRQTKDLNDMTATAATNAEFFLNLEKFFCTGQVSNMAEIENHYRNIANKFGVSQDDVPNRKTLKRMILNELPHLALSFSNPRKKNEPQTVSLNITKDVAFDESLKSGDCSEQLKTLCSAASILRKAIFSQKCWNFDGTLEVTNFDDIIPKELIHFIQWTLGGCIEISDKNSFNQFKIAEIKKRTQLTSQIIMQNILSDRQINYDQKSGHLRVTKELPLQVATGLTVHHKTRSKFIVQMCSSIGISINYTKVLTLETRIAASVLKQIQENEGVYIPPNIVIGKRVYFAFDNLDFQENTPDGKGTLHGTVITVYQEIGETDDKRIFRLLEEDNDNQINIELPNVFTDTSNKPYKKIKSQNDKLNAIPDNCFSLSDFKYQQYVDLCWQLGQYYDDKNNSQVPAWQVFNSIFESTRPQARVCLLPMIPRSPTKVSVQIAVLKIIENLNKKVTNETELPVVTVDMGLYVPVQELLMANKDIECKYILRPGELHIIMAQLRCIGSFIRGTGIADIWTEANIFEQSTANQILEGGNIRRAISAHIFTASALYIAYFEVFFAENLDLHDNMKDIVLLFNNLDSSELNSKMERKSNQMELLRSKLEQFDQKYGQDKPTFRMMRTYMRMVDSMLLFIRAVRSSNWELHLSALEDFCKYFFAMDQLNYARMIPLYLHQMYQLKTSNEQLWLDLKKGNWAVNRSVIPFCALGADEALEQQNRRLKVTGGLSGITQNAQALTRFFLCAPELERIAEEAEENIFMTLHSNEKIKHHSRQSQNKRHQQNVQEYLSTLKLNLNPFTYDENNLVCLSSSIVFSKEIQNYVDTIAEIGQKSYESFVQNRIITGSEGNIWDPMKKNKLQLCRSNLKKLKVATKATTLEIKEDRSLFTRILVATRMRPEIDLKQIISNYELAPVPRSMFNSHGVLHLCSKKSELLSLLEKCPSESDYLEKLSEAVNVAVVDAMAELQSFGTENLATCDDLAISFCNKLLCKYKEYSEIHVVFDTYKKDSLKNLTRDNRNATNVRYRITPSMKITKIPMKKLLSHIETKTEIIEYLAKKIICFGKEKCHRIVVSLKEEILVTFDDDEEYSGLVCDHEEADTKILLHSIFLAKQNKHVHIFSPDTDVFVLAISWCTHYPNISFFHTGIGSKHRAIALNPICKTLGPSRVSALLGFHAISGSDTTGTFYRKGKKTFWAAFLNADEDELQALARLKSEDANSEDNFIMLEKFVCQVFCPKTKITSVELLRWHMFTKKQMTNDLLPPTKGSLTSYLKRANYQTIVWSRSNLRYQNLPSPLSYGWIYENNRYSPVFSESSLNVPLEIFNITKCTCKKRCVLPCKCYSNEVFCTELCNCEGENCVNNERF